MKRHVSGSGELNLSVKTPGALSVKSTECAQTAEAIIMAMEVGNIYQY